MDRERVVIAEIVRPRGNQGEVVVRSQTDVPGRLESLKTATVRLADGVDLPIVVTTAWQHKGEWVLKFAGVDSISAAERFRGAELWVPFAERGQLGSGEFFSSDLIGCRVVDKTTGQEVGVVEGWQQYGGPPLMEVIVDKREVLIPFVAEICDVDLAAGVIRAELPEGLLDL